MYNKKKIFYLIIVIILLIAARYIIKQINLDETPDEAVTVEFIELKKENMQTTLSFIAEAEAINIVNLRPQISGYIKEIKFDAGTSVNKDDVLFVIEQSRYEAALMSAKANLNKAQSNLKQQQASFERQKSLYGKNFSSKANFEQAESAAQQAQADVETAESEVKLAEINLDYTVIKSPIKGYISKATVTDGNYVDNSTESLARIVQLNPIRITFSLTEQQRAEILNNGEIKENVTLELVLPNGKKLPMTEEKCFMDNEVNRSTGTLPIHFEIENTDNKLLPGDYVDVVATFENKDAIIIPQTAISVDSKGNYAFVIDENNIVHKRYISVSDAQKGEVNVIEGLASGEKIVSEGIVKIQDGMKVKPQ